MNCDLNVLTVEALENNHICRFSNDVGVEGEGHLNLAISALGRECGFRSHRLIVHSHRLAGGFVHERSLHNVFLAGSEVVIGNDIVNSDLAADGRFFLSVSRSLGLDFGDYDRHGLILVLNVRMNSQLFAVAVEALEHDDARVCLDELGVEGEQHLHAAGGSFGNKGYLGGDLLSVLEERFAGRLIHKDALDGVLLAGDKVLVLNRISEREHLGGTDFLLIVNGGSRADFGDQIVHCGDLDHVAVLIHSHGIDSLVFEIASSRTQLTHGIAAVHHVRKGEDAVLAGLSGKESIVLGEAGFVRAEEAEQSAGDLVAGFTIDLIALDRAVDQFIGDVLAVVHGDVDGGDFLTGILEYHGVFLIGENVMTVSADLLDIGFGANGKIGAESGIAVLIALDHLEHPASGNAAAVCRNDFLCGKQTKVDGSDFTIVSDAEDAVLLHDLVQIDLDLLPLVVEASGSLGNLDLLACIGQLDGLNGGIEDHAIRSLCLNDMEPAQEQRLGHSLAVLFGNENCHDLILAVAQGTIQRVDILGCGHGVLGTGQTADLVNQALAVLGVNDGGEILTGLFHGDNAHLRRVLLGYDNHGHGIFLRGVFLCNVEIHGIAVENVPVRSRHLDQRIALTVFQLLGGNQHTVAVRVEGVDGSDSRIGEGHLNLIAGRIVDVEADAGSRNGLTGRAVDLDHLYIGVEVGVVDQVAVGFSIFADEHVERLQEFSTFPTLGLLDGVSAVGQILRLSEAVLIADQIIALGVLGIVIGACALEIDGELCAFLRSLDLRLAVIGVLDDSDIAFLNLFVLLHGLAVILCGIVLRTDADLLVAGSNKIALAAVQLLDRPVGAADIVFGGELAIRVGDIGVDQLVALVDSVLGACQIRTALSRAGFDVLLGNS